MNAYKADIHKKNKDDKTPEQLATKTVKDKNVLETIIKLLQKRTTSTFVDTKKEIREENKQDQKKLNYQVTKLRDTLK